MSEFQWSPREWSRWDASDMDGQTREGEAFGLKPNQPCEIDGRPERVSMGNMRIKASGASGFSIEAIESKLSRRSAVRSSV